MELPFEDNTFDHVYVIEAACHAPEKVRIRFFCFLSTNFVFIRLNVLRKFIVY